MPKKGKKSKKKSGEKTDPRSRTKSQKSVLAYAAANSKLWETRLGVAEASRNDYRDCARRLVVENEELNNTMVRNERDMVEVIAYLKQKLTEQQTILEEEQENSRSLRVAMRHEKESLITDFQQKMNHLEEKLKVRNDEVQNLKDELKFARDFRRKRDEMLKDLSDLKDAMENANKVHREEFGRLEKKFLLEKVQTEKESRQRISELSEKTHLEALAKLDDVTKEVFKENVRLKEALNLEVKQNEVLKKLNEDISAENTKLKGELHTTKLALQNKMSQDTKDKKQLSAYKNKVETLENSLTHVVREFDVEKSKLASSSSIQDSTGVSMELARLQRIMELKSKEMVKIRRLAKTILDQRTELETFFMSALEDVKNEILKDRSSSKPKRPDQSSSAFESIENALTESQLSLKAKSKVDISELSWTEKERVLRYLFAKMNAHSVQKTGSSTISKDVQKHQNKSSDAKAQRNSQTFITQNHTVTENL